MSSCFNMYSNQLSRNIFKEIGSSVSLGDFSEYGKYNITYYISKSIKIIKMIT